MSLRTHAVVVQPDRWSGAPSELARLLAPITGSEIAPLTAALARGPMTVEADLSSDDAKALFHRLESMGVPAEIEPPTDGSSGPGAIPALQSERSRVTDEVPRKRRSTVVGHKPMATEGGAGNAGGWGSLFPDLVEPEPVAKPGPPSLDDLETPSQTPQRSRATTAPLFGGENVTEPTPPLRRSNALKAPSPSTTSPPSTGPKPAPPQPASQPKSPAKTPLKPDGFDASKLAALLPEDSGEQPPHKPTGFDPRPEHHPPFAVMFAALAPGGGLVFNGHDDEAVSLAMRSWMIVPWVRSIGAARADAEKIRTFWAPRPEDGSGIRAFKFVFSFWLIVGMAVAIASFAISAMTDVADREPVQEGPTAEQLTSAFNSAGTRVLGARVGALDAVDEATKDVIPDQQFTLTPAERGARLFAIGLVECKRRNFSMCEAMMKRVLQLKPAYPPAIKLQAWASVSRNGRNDTMPVIQDDMSLSEMEINKMRQEMALEGEDVPPPPEPVADTPDAGSIVEQP